MIAKRKSRQPRTDFWLSERFRSAVENPGMKERLIAWLDFDTDGEVDPTEFRILVKL